MTSLDVRAAEPTGQPGPSISELLAAEHRAVPVVLKEQHQVPLPTGPISTDRYHSYDWHRREVTKVWQRVWQVACRVDELLDPGDHVVYDIVDDSVIVTRTAAGDIRAFINVCLHRGTKLRVADGNVPAFRCPFHGFMWNLDGSLADIPSAWDYPQLDTTQFDLPEVRCDVWGGFVWINLDANCAPLAEQLEVLPEHFAHTDFATRMCTFHASKVVPANWKIVMEAFNESYHVIATHPQILESNGDANTQYDTWGANVNRMINAFAVRSPHLGDTITEQDVADDAAALFARILKDPIVVPDGEQARPVVADAIRARLSKMTGIDYSNTSDAELLDAIQYFAFPNFSPWFGITQSLVYRWRPNGDDPNTSIMDVWRLTSVPPGMDHPRCAPHQHLTLDQDWHAAEGMGLLASIFEQDMSNLWRVHAGIKASKRPLTLSLYQESRLRHFHAALDARLAD
jgi:phenylpropionate dioxygenase-like ring-hydroxylating dioxygenase large terminal subunit